MNLPAYGQAQEKPLPGLTGPQQEMSGDDEFEITVPVSFIHGPVAPGQAGTAGFTPEAQEQVRQALIARFGEEKARQAWPHVEKMILEAIRAVEQGQKDGAVEF